MYVKGFAEFMNSNHPEKLGTSPDLTRVLLRILVTKICLVVLQKSICTDAFCQTGTEPTTFKHKMKKTIEKLILAKGIFVEFIITIKDKCLARKSAKIMNKVLKLQAILFNFTF